MPAPAHAPLAARRSRPRGATHWRPRSPMSDARLVDLGFTRFKSERKGRVSAVVALARWSALRALGARRPWTAKLVPVALVLLAFGPASSCSAPRAIVGDRVELPEILPYADYYGVIGVIVLVFVAMTTPELLCPDRRDRVLDLYLATAVSPFEYVLGKFLAALVPLLCLTFVPAVHALRRQRDLRRGRVRLPAGQRRHRAQDRHLRAPPGDLLLAARAGHLVAHRPAAVRRRRLPRPDARSPPASPAALVGLYEGTPEFEILALGINPIALVQHVFGNFDDDGVSWTWRFGSWLVVVRRLLARAVAALPAGGAMNEPRVVLEAASKWYGTTVALSEVSFALGPGVTGLLGKNGAGKSTALKLLAGFATPDRGTVRVLGRRPARRPRRAPPPRRAAGPRRAVAVHVAAAARVDAGAPARRRRPRGGRAPRAAARSTSTPTTAGP